MNVHYANGGLALLIPAYNAAKFLPRLFASVKAQTRAFDEIWVYDDCSTDNTSEVARNYGARVVRGAENRGCSYGKNVLAAQTKCKWIHFHDADDELLAEFVERAHYWIQQDKCDVVLFPYEEREEGTGSFITLRRFDPDDVKKDPISYSIREQINPFCGLYRRDAFLEAGGYDTDPRVLYNEDVAMHCRLAQAGLKFVADDRVLVINNRRLDSMSASNQAKCLAAHYHVMKKASEALGHQYYGAIAQRLWVVAGGASAYLDWDTADAAATLAMKLAGTKASESSPLFKGLCWISPRLAIRTRELLIRLVKPRYRWGHPGWKLKNGLSRRGRP